MSPILAPLNPVVCGKRAVATAGKPTTGPVLEHRPLAAGRAERGRPRSGSLSEHLTRVFFAR